MFDAQVVLSPKTSPLGKVLSNYVVARIIRLDNVDLGLFDYDRNNTLYFFMLNADEQIYLRYGGRDSVSPDSYLNLESLELAAKKGLELHEQYKAGKLAKTVRPKPLSARQIPLLVKRTFDQGNCVECHLVGDFQNLHREQDGTLDKLVHLWRSPDIKTLGIELDVPKGLVVKEAKGAAAAAGIRAGDLIKKWEGTPVYSFGDWQYRHDKVARDATKLTATIERGGADQDVTLDLPVRWWWTDTRFRYSSVEPKLYFEDRPLTAEDKKKLGLDPNGFASQVKYVSEVAKTMKSHGLEVGDVIVAVDGVSQDKIAHTAELYLKLRKTPGDQCNLEVLRNGQKVQVPLKTFRMSFRK